MGAVDIAGVCFGPKNKKGATDIGRALEVPQFYGSITRQNAPYRVPKVVAIKIKKARKSNSERGIKNSIHIIIMGLLGHFYFGLRFNEFA